MKGNELPPDTVELSEWINERKLKTKSDLTALSVASQVLVSELFEKVDVLSTEISSLSLPALKSALEDLHLRFSALKPEHSEELPQSRDGSTAARLSESLTRMSELARARSNIELVLAHLNST